MVMTVSMPTTSAKDEYGMPLNYTGCQVTLQHRKNAQFGRANQKWSHDNASGYIFAFSSSSMDKGNTERHREFAVRCAGRQATQHNYQINPMKLFFFRNHSCK